MGNILTEFHSFSKINDNAILLELGKEYMCHDIFLKKIGSEINKNIDLLVNDIADLRKQYPGKLASEISTDKIIEKMKGAAGDLLSCDDKIKSDIMSGKFAASLNSQLKEMKGAVNKLWVQVKGSDLKFSRKDSLGNLIGRSQIFSGLGSLASLFIKLLAVILVIAVAGFIYLYITMEKEDTYIKENLEISAYIEQQLDRVKEIEARKSELQDKLAVENRKELTSKVKIAILDMELEIQELNNELHGIEGSINSRKTAMSENNQRIEELEKKSLFEKLFGKN